MDETPEQKAVETPEEKLAERLRFAADGPAEVERADPKAEMKPGGEGVPAAEPEPETKLPEDPDAAEQRRLGEIYDEKDNKFSKTDSHVWLDKPQVADQILQPDMARPSRFETKIFHLDEEKDRHEYDKLMTESQSTSRRFILTRERQWSAETRTWYVILEIQWFEFRLILGHDRLAKE